MNKLKSSPLFVGHIDKSGELRFSLCDTGTSNSLKTYCKKCKRWFYGWGKKICPVCETKLLSEEDMVSQERERQEVLKSKS